MQRIISFAFLTILTTWPLHAQENFLGPHFQREPVRSDASDVRGAYSILAPVKPWDLLGQDYQLTADSAVDRNGDVYFTDAKRNRILRIDREGKISIWREGSNGAHGVAFGPDGRLYAGQHDRKRIVAFSREGAESVIAEGVQTHHFTVTSRSEIYLTVAPAHKVWMVDAVGRQRVVHEGINWPRSARVSPDETLLVVNDPPTQLVWSFQIQADGALTNGRASYRLEASAESPETDAGGMAFDSEGFLYVATKQGVQVFDSLGRVTAIIKTPGAQGVSNVFFAGPGLQWLYVTTWDTVFRLPVKRRGVGPWNVAKPQNPRP